MKKPDEISVLAANYLAGEMNEKESDNFLKIMNNDKDLKKEFEVLKETWEHVKVGSVTPDSKLAWNNLHSRLENDGLLPDTKVRSFQPSNFILRIAAGIIIFIAISIPGYFLLNEKFQNENDAIRYIANQSISIYDLPDGSRVYLKNGTEIFVSENFQKERNVRLIGEAFFDIMADPTHPFSIETDFAVVTVLGTSFNVKENRQSEETEILVESGKVKVDGKNGEELVLESGEFAKAGRNSLKIEKNNNPNYLAWKTREFQFTNEKLEMVFNLLEEVYRVKIHVQDKEIEELRLTSSYNQQSIDSILQTIGTAFDLKINRKNTNYEIRKD